jgi:histidyl-tRNA synthetase
LKKQLKYAHSNKIPLVVFINRDFSSEMKVEVKNMDTGEQKDYLLSDL